MSLVGRWLLVNNSLDSLGLHNGTDTSITYPPAAFNGSTSQIDFGDPASFNFSTGNFSVFCRLTTTATTRKTAVNKWSMASQKGLFVDLLATGKVRCISASSGANFYAKDTNTVINTGVEFGVGFVKSGGVVTAYINGVLDTGSAIISGTVGDTDSGTNLTLGKNIGVSTNWNGTIRDFQLFNTALTAAEMLAVYQGNNSNFFLMF